MPIRPLSVYSWAKRKNRFPFIRVIRVPILAVDLKLIRVPIIPVLPKNVIPVNLIHFNPKHCEAMPIRPLSVYSWAKRKNRFPFIRVIRVPILAVDLKLIRVQHLAPVFRQRRLTADFSNLPDCIRILTTDDQILTSFFNLPQSNFEPLNLSPPPITKRTSKRHQGTNVQINRPRLNHEPMPKLSCHPDEGGICREQLKLQKPKQHNNIKLSHFGNFL